jgi:excisionase family DNA binding protein
VARLPGGKGAAAPLDAALRLMRRRGRSAQSTKMPPEVLSRLLTVQELADLLQVPVKTIYTWRYKGIGPPAVPLGRYLRFRADDVAAWLEKRADPVRPDALLDTPWGTR